MPEFEAAQARSAENQLNPTTLLPYIAGIGLIAASFFKFHQHKQNPTQDSLAAAVLLLTAGVGFILFGITQQGDDLQQLAKRPVGPSPSSPPAGRIARSPSQGGVRFARRVLGSDAH
jgi:hypothetical protein